MLKDSIDKVQKQVGPTCAVENQESGYPWLKKSWGKLLGCGDDLFLDLGADYADVFSWWKFIKLYILDLYPFSCVFYTLKKFKQ